MLSTRDSLQIKRCTLTKGKEMEKRYFMKMKTKQNKKMLGYQYSYQTKQT